MSGILMAPLAPGDRCIIHVNEVNTPTGWWWGIVEAVEQRSGYACCNARITGEFRFTGDYKPQPIYDGTPATPTVNYTVYAADPGTVDIVRILIRSEDRNQEKIRELRVRLDDRQAIIKAIVGEDTLRRIVASELAKAAKAAPVADGGGK